MGRFLTSSQFFGRFLLAAILGGFVLQIAVPVTLDRLGAKNAAIWSILPGLYPILWATRGWFASVSPLGSLLMSGINTAVYGAVLFGVLVCCRRRALRRDA